MIQSCVLWLALASAAIGLGLASTLATPAVAIATSVTAMLVASVIAATRARPISALMTLNLTAAVFTITWNGVRIPGDFTLSDLFLLLAVVFGAAAAGAGERSLQVTPSLRLLGYFGAILAAGGIVGGALAGSTDGGGTAALRFTIAIAACWLVAALIEPSLPSAGHFLFHWVAGSSINAIVALRVNHSSGRALGLSDHPNHLGLAMVMTFFAAVALFSVARRLTRYFAVAGAGLAATGIVQSGSRASLIGLIAGIASLAVFRGVRSVVLYGSLGLVGVTVLLWSPLAPVEDGTTALDRVFAPDQAVASSNEARSESVADAWALYRRHMLTGVGFEEARSAHNLPIQMLVTAGPAGLVALIILAKFSGRVWRLARRSGVMLAQPIGAGVIGVLCALVFSNNVWDRFLLLFLTVGSVTVELTGRNRTRLSFIRVESSQPNR